MYKNFIISALAAVLIIRSVPYFAACEPRELIVIFIGFFMPLLFFCFFCDSCAEKWRNHAKGERRLAEYIRSLGQEDV